MKKEDLMIGDWVNFNGTIDKVQEILYVDNKPKPLGYCASFAASATLFPIEIDKIIPISLTEDILKKNSFLEVEAIEYPSHSVGISFLYRNTPEGLRIFVQNACAGGPTCTMIKTCKYVHEVQHVIKMCDIERTFVL